MLLSDTQRGLHQQGNNTTILMHLWMQKLALQLFAVIGFLPWTKLVNKVAEAHQ
jgi:hypothetical protein